jgi:hypothetical protein
MTENPEAPIWIIEANEAPTGESPNWAAVWETWFSDDDADANAKAKETEKEYVGKNQDYEMTPRPFLACLERLKTLRPNHNEWVDYRFCNTESGMQIFAWLLKS